jgi:chromosome segregation ATPase
LRLACQVQIEGSTDRGHLEVAEDEVQCLHKELEVSLRSREDLTHQEVLARSQIEALTSQMTGLKDMMAVQETELISTGAARDMAEQGHQHLEAECQKLRSACSSESPPI